MLPLEQRLAANSGLILAIFAVLLVAGLAADVVLYRRFRDRAGDWPGSLFRVTWRPWDWPEAAGLVALIIGTVLLARLLNPAVMKLAGRHADFASLVYLSVTTYGAVLAGVWFLARIRRIDLHGAFGCRRAHLLRDLREGALFLLALIPPLLPLVYLNAILLDLFGIDPSLQPLLTQYADADSIGLRIYIAVWAVLVAPLAEEVLFRGVGLPALLKHFPPAVAILLVSVIFAALHNHAPAFLPLMALSIAMCIAYLATESLVAPIAMHALFNGMTTTIVLLAS